MAAVFPTSNRKFRYNNNNNNNNNGNNNSTPALRSKYHEIKMTDPYKYLALMESDENLARSAGHQAKFLARRKELNDNLSLAFPPELLYQATGNHNTKKALVLDDEWVYIHIWKSGGTTIYRQFRRPQKRLIADEAVQNRTKWLTFVRDPVDRFLSGYSECLTRHYQKNSSNDDDVDYQPSPPPAAAAALPPPWDEAAYDTQIREWLYQTTMHANGRGRGWQRNVCEHHSYPQVNFILDDNGQTILDNITVIGDLSEMPAFLGRMLSSSSNFTYNHARGASRVAAHNEFKSRFFPARRDLLSNATLRGICKFLALDYYFLDFELPPACQEDSNDDEEEEKYEVSVVGNKNALMSLATSIQKLLPADESLRLLPHVE